MLNHLVICRDSKFFGRFGMSRRGTRYQMCYTVGLGWLGSVVIGRQTSDRKIASSTPDWCIASSLGQLSLPSLQDR